MHLEMGVNILLGQVGATTDSCLKAVSNRAFRGDWRRKLESVKACSRTPYPRNILDLKLFMLSQEIGDIVEYLIYVGGHECQR